MAGSQSGLVPAETRSLLRRGLAEPRGDHTGYCARIDWEGIARHHDYQWRSAPADTGRSTVLLINSQNEAQNARDIHRLPGSSSKASKS